MELCIVAYFEVFRTKYEAKCSNSCVKCKSKFISRPVTIQDVILCLDIYPLIIHEANRGTSKNSNAAEERNRKARAFAVVAKSSSKVICAYRVLMCNSSLKEKNWKDPNYSWARWSEIFAGRFLLPLVALLHRCCIEIGPITIAWFLVWCSCVDSTMC